MFIARTCMLTAMDRALNPCRDRRIPPEEAARKAKDLIVERCSRSVLTHNGLPLMGS
jgi:hypothetical protein